MGAFGEEKEGLNVPKGNLTDFFDDLEGRLALMTGLVPMEDMGLTLRDVRRPIFVSGLPGIGKTCGIMSIRKKLNALLPADKQLGMKKILLGQTVVGSMTGIPVNVDGKVVRMQMPDLPDVERDGEYGVLFLDEITTADEAQVQPALGLCDDSRNIGEYSLPEHWIVVAAGNGPDCSNFLRMDDMTLSRFTVYDVAYDYKKDWRPWAHENGIDSDIIAFLNFDPTACVRVESTDMDSAGKLFPCPRTWERLSTELKIRKALKKPVDANTLANFAGRIVGIKAGREFAAFCAYHSKVEYTPEDIFSGKANKPVPMDKQVFHIILQGCIKYGDDMLTGKADSQGNYSADMFQKVANMMNWFLAFETYDFESCIQAIIELRSDTKYLKKIAMDLDFSQFCPEFDEFLARNGSYIFENLQDFMDFN